MQSFDQLLNCVVDIFYTSSIGRFPHSIGEHIDAQWGRQLRTGREQSAQASIAFWVVGNFSRIRLELADVCFKNALQGTLWV